jgi:hypothetical protein
MSYTDAEGRGERAVTQPFLADTYLEVLNVKQTVF